MSIIAGATLTCYAAEKPNVIIIFADDMGYGDVSALNPTGKIATPNIDRLASEGMTFTEGHSTSSVCTPSRYGLLTGRYNWRSPLKHHILRDLAPPLIPETRRTLGNLMQNQGYGTAAFGKWHLGSLFPKKGGGHVKGGKRFQDIDFSKPIEAGPIARGFDHYYGTLGSPGFLVASFVEDDRWAETPSVLITKELVEEKYGGHLKNGIASQSYHPEQVMPEITQRAVRYIEESAADKPFFIYMPLTAPHGPICPNKPFIGRSGLGDYADFCLEIDWSVGQVLDALDRRALANNTLVFFSADNGITKTSHVVNFEQNHDSSVDHRGWKSVIYQGGTHVPFLVRWPDTIAAGSCYERPVSTVDWFATLAEITGANVAENEAEDSLSLLPVLRGEKTASGSREAIITSSAEGMLAIHRWPWKLCFGPGDGGRGDQDSVKSHKAGMPAMQLFRLDEDRRESKNLMESQPEVTKELVELMTSYVAKGRSVPGSVQKNEPAGWGLKADDWILPPGLLEKAAQSKTKIPKKK
jgi:arylsulfatase A-like enzyme